MGVESAQNMWLPCNKIKIPVLHIVGLLYIHISSKLYLFFSLFVSTSCCLYMMLPAWSSALVISYTFRCISIFHINAFCTDDFVCVCILGNLNSGDEVLEWLRKNRFRQPELNVFMYAVIALAITFVMYTVWLLSCFRPHMKQA
jgi:hypothetical protein